MLEKKFPIFRVVRKINFDLIDWPEHEYVYSIQQFRQCLFWTYWAKVDEMFEEIRP
jgi:hypothetical protein